MTDFNNPTPQSAHDSRPLPWKVLTSEEKNIIDRFNDLLRAIKEENPKTPPVRWGPKYRDYPWALPEWDRRSGVIMLDGPRGVGKTSLLLTMIAGWLKPEDVDGAVFKDMNETVKPLTPLDFDPLPPELPLYSWIVQAFEPLVEKVGGPSRDDDFPYDMADDRPDETVRDRFRRLQRSAAVGWTTGLLKYALAKDLGEFLLWQGEQQVNWQRLQLDWQCFLDELFRHLERSDSALPKNAVIALPIDDLDLQAHRLRELLLALRTLRHERLVYVLTGDVENIDISLKAEFYLSYLRREPTIPEKLRDEIAEQMEKLSLSLREKVIPGPHTFSLKGLPLVEATDWRPTPESPTLGEILDTLWTGKNQEQQESNNEKTLSGFLSQRSEVVRGSSVGDHMLLFRPLQAFFDRWGGKGHERNLNGIVDFLNIAIGRQEEPVTVVRSDSDVERIELSTDLGVYAPAPRLLGVVRTQTFTLHWMREVDFARKPLALEWNVEAQMFRVGRVVSQAPVEHLLALDLAAWKPKVFQIINGPSLTERPLSITWTQIDGTDGRVFLPWPMASSPPSPSEWIKRVSQWNKHLELYTKNDGPNEETLVKAWCSFLGKRDTKPNTTLQQHLKDAKETVGRQLSILAARLSGLTNDIRDTIAQELGVKESDVDQESVKHAFWWQMDLGIPVDPYQLALQPIVPEANNMGAIQKVLDSLPSSHKTRSRDGRPTRR